MNKIGYIKSGTDIYTYQMGESSAVSSNVSNDEYKRELTPISINGYWILPFGENNLEPNDAKEMISNNRLLPELIEKQIKMLYGQGPVLYKIEIDDKGLPIKNYVKDNEIQKWLETWQENGLQDSYLQYLNKCIRTFYYSEGIFTKWILSRGINLGYKPVTGLEHVSVLRCRFASTRNLSGRIDLEPIDFNKLIVANWKSNKEYKVYPVFSHVKPFVNSAISYSKNPTHGEEIYAFNVFYRGIRDWIKGANLSAKYVNSYLENALSARLHIIIPNAWLKSKEIMLSAMCERNARLKEDSGNNEIHYEKIKFSDSDILEVGTEYHDGLLNEFASMELKKLGKFLSGSGKNQGKFYASYSFVGETGDEQRWKIEEIPQKYKEYIEAIKSYDERADSVMLAAKGIDSSISNISKEGVISKSGSDALYNYLIYLNGLTIPEEVVCADINHAIKLNFPSKYAEGIRLGFYRPAIAQQQNTAPENRMSNQKSI